MADVKTVSVLEIRGQSTGLDKVQRDLQGVAAASREAAAAQGEVTRTMTRSATSFETSSRAFDSLHARLDPTVKALRDYERSMRTVEKAQRAGIASQSDSAKVVSLLEARLASATRATTAHGQAAGLASHQLSNLSYQLNDVVTSLASGGSPLQVLAQQGGQVLQVFQSGQGGLVGGLRAFGTTLAGLVTPAAAVGTAVAAIGATAAISFARSEAQVTRLQVALNGLGRASGATVDSLLHLADAGASRAGLSVAESRDIVADSIGKGIGTGNTSKILDLSKAFGRATGTDAREAGKALSDALQDPAKGAALLEERFGTLSDAQRALIRDMTASGQTARAQELVLNGLAQAVAGNVDVTWNLSRAWAALEAAISNGGEAIGEGLRRSLDPTTLERYRHELEAVQKQWNIWKGGMVDAPDSASKTPEIDDLNEQLRRQNQLASARARDAAANAASTKAGDIVRSVLPDVQALKDLENQYKALQAAIDAPGGLEKMGVGADAAREALSRLGRAIDSYASSSDKQARADELALRGIMARTDAEKEAIATAQKLNELRGNSSVDQNEANRQALQAAAMVRAQTVRDAQDQLRQVQDANAGAGSPDFQKGLAAIVQQYNRLREAAQGSAEAIRLLNQAQGEAIRAYTSNAVNGPLKEANRSLQEQVAGLRVQQESFGKSTGEAARLAAAQDLLNQYLRAGVPITDQLKEAINSYASQAGAAAQAADDLAKEQRGIIQSMDDVRSVSGSALSTFVDDIANGKHAGEALRDTLKGIFADITKIAERDIMSSLFGDAGTTGQGSLLGGGLFNLLGGNKSKVNIPSLAGQSTAVMNVQAGVVNLSGAGLGGGNGTGGIGDLVSDGVKKLAEILPGWGKGSGVPSLSTVNPTQDPAVALSAGRNPLAGADVPSLLGSFLSKSGGGGGAGGSIADYIRSAAVARNIDPDVALKVAQSEGGLSSWNQQSYATLNGVREPSFGPFQLLKGGPGTGFGKGLGNAFQQQTGLDPANAANGPAGVDFALDQAKANGWGAWYGAKNAGISQWQGINPGKAGESLTDASAGLDKLTDSAKQLPDATSTATSSLSSLADAAKPLAKGVGDVGDTANAAVDPLKQASTGIGGLTDSLKSMGQQLGGGGGGGGGGFLSWLFGSPAKYTGPADGIYGTGGDYHNGGLVRPGGGRFRTLDPAWFATAPRHHSGKLMPGEMPAILQTGELVLSRGHVAAARMAAQDGARDRGSKGNSRGDMRVQVNNYASKDTETTERRLSDDDGEMLVLDIVKKGMSSGKLDSASRARYGNIPKSTRRG